jgi:hypothetical protein
LLGGLGLGFGILWAALGGPEAAALFASVGAIPLMAGWSFGELQRFRGSANAIPDTDRTREGRLAMRIALASLLIAIGSAVFFFILRPQHWAVSAALWIGGVWMFGCNSVLFFIVSRSVRRLSS